MAIRKKFRAIWDNRFFDAAALTPSSEVATLPAVNVQDRLRQRVWRTTGAAGQYLIANLGSPTDPEDVRPPVSALALVNHNLTRSAQITIQASETPDFGAPLINETHDAWADIIGAGEGGAGGPPGAGGVIFDCHRSWYTPRPLSIIYLDKGALEARGYWKIAFNDALNPDGYLQVGRVFLTYYDDFKYDWGWPWTLGGQDDSTISYSPGGYAWTDKRPFLRTLRFGWNQRFSDEDKYWRLFFMVQQMGKHTDWVCDPIPEGVSSRFFTALYGRFSEIPEMEQWISGFSELELQIIESM